MNRRARGGGNSNCRWAGILIVADQRVSTVRFPFSISRTNRRESSSIESQASLPEPRPTRIVGFFTATPPARPACDRPPPTPVDVVRGSDGRRPAQVGMDFRQRPRPGWEPRAAQKTVATPPGLCNGSPRSGWILRQLPGNQPLPNGSESRCEFSGHVGVGEVHRPLGPERERFLLLCRSIA